MFNGIHLSIEGMDGVGKTTVCRLIEKELGFRYIEKPLQYLFREDGDYDTYIRVRDYVNDDPDRVFTSWFYGLGSTFLYSRFNGEKIVTDRHLLSNYTWSGEKESEPVFETLVKVLGVPTMTVILYSRPEVIEQRLKKRDVEDSDLKKVTVSEEKYAKMKHFVEKYDMPHIFIDTSDLTPEQTVDIIADKMREIKAI